MTRSLVGRFGARLRTGGGARPAQFPLQAVLAIAISAMLARANDRAGQCSAGAAASSPRALALFGIERAPSHATYHYVFRSLDGDALSAGARRLRLRARRTWRIALDGKTLRGSRRLDAKALRVVSAFATQLSAWLAISRCAEENEITAGARRCSRSCRSRARSSPATRSSANGKSVKRSPTDKATICSW